MDADVVVLLLSIMVAPKLAAMVYAAATRLCGVIGCGPVASLVALRRDVDLAAMRIAEMRGEIEELSTATALPMVSSKGPPQRLQGSGRAGLGRVLFLLQDPVDIEMREKHRLLIQLRVEEASLERRLQLAARNRDPPTR